MMRRLVGGALFCTLVAISNVSSGQITTLQDAGIWLDAKSTALVRGSRHAMNDGTTAFMPQSGTTTYPIFVLRDYAYMLEGCSASTFTNTELRNSCQTFVNAIRSSDGAAVDCVGFDGAPYYKNGYNTMGDNPVADGTPFTIHMAWLTNQRLKDPMFVQQIIDPLVRTMNAAPRDPANGLIYINPSVAWDRVGYGFTDCIKKSGDDLFCSLLDYQASNELADLLSTVGRNTEAAAWRTAANSKAAAIGNTFWDAGTGLFNSATVSCAQPDIWGSAFAVQLGVASSAQSTAVAQYFKDHYSEIVQNGQIRHLPGGTYWNVMTGVAPGTYQNGGFWGTATGLVASTLHQVDSTLADQTVLDMVANYRQNGVYEWVNSANGGVGAFNYVDSTALPLAAVRQMCDLPDQPLLKETGGTLSAKDVALASNGGTAFAKNVLSGFSIHQIDHLNDGLYGNDNSWVAASDESFAGIAFDEAYTIGALAFGRDNIGSFSDRYGGVYMFQYTRLADPNANTPDSAWITFGAVDPSFSESLRHLYEFAPIDGVTGIRILVDDSSLGPGYGNYIGIDELEVYAVPEPTGAALLFSGLLGLLAYVWRKRP
jgi:hypothetical protein